MHPLPSAAAVPRRTQARGGSGLWRLEAAAENAGRRGGEGRGPQAARTAQAHRGEARTQPAIRGPAGGLSLPPPPAAAAAARASQQSRLRSHGPRRPPATPPPRTVAGTSLPYQPSLPGAQLLGPCVTLAFYRDNRETHSNSHGGIGEMAPTAARGGGASERN
ncbi:zinc finger protein ZIC 5-like [Symphalangus syndactylus]|uniref:zinc finger protein ZIC 5-like n=1 Tax=Symphalangus syndactylus TaxID=9590 RepID=UPI0030066A9F